MPDMVLGTEKVTENVFARLLKIKVKIVKYVVEKDCLRVNRQVLEPYCCHLKLSVLFNISQRVNK